MAEKMEGVETAVPEQPKGQTSQQATDAIVANFALLDQAVNQFDGRFTLRVLRSIPGTRKSPHFTEALSNAITHLYSSNTDSPAKKFLLTGLGANGAGVTNGDAAHKPSSGEPLPESFAYLAILVQIHLHDTQKNSEGAEFSSILVDRLREYNRRTLDALSAKAFFYFHLFYEQLDPKPPSRQSPVIEVRSRLLAALRSSVLRKDADTQASVTVLLLRNYLSTADITQADLLVGQTQFPTNASNNQVCRFLYYLGRIRAIQLSYTAAHEHLTSATRKSPAHKTAAGFYQTAMKLLVVVELLMGDIPDRAIFRQASLENALYAYFKLVQTVRVGDLQGFNKVVEQNADQFKKDGTYTLILRLRQNVIKTGVRMLSLSYSRISLRDICLRLGVESEESAEYIVAKAIRDGVIEAGLDHEHGFMESKQAGDIYATREPAEAFHDRIKACLNIHDECVMAMRYPMNKHRQELKNAQEARERERELAKEIQEGDIDEDDAGDGFEGM
ncbi:26S proteasome non-ATPase regulatory subunit 3 [Myriangium duriaei CBS 260.36]|uniref:26S proteasome non-ATPase regulatory subunit 3 n=1 Tax=Myriangium duriaei CBS 260.36 TaxID=1168546 RepID=A0A9P4MH04_9PEZI|nr:26S proteasome non-ATPase regulatory subunit 3 [Myriangium duriaei CBS 260.36]